LLKRAALVLGVALFSVVAVLGMMFGGLAPASDGTALPGNARMVRAGFVNLYVLPAGDGQVALVDCGADATGAAIERELGRRGLSDDAVAAIFLTHGHRDHIAACRRFTRARVYSFADEVPIIEGRATARGPLPRLRGPVPASQAPRVTDVLVDGASVKVGALTVRAFVAPGHTAGSGVFLANGVLYVGDSAAVDRSGRLRGAPWIFSDDQSQNLASLRRLQRTLAPERARIRALAFGHSGPWMSAAPLFDFKR
jgi:glyoxylase-like metal-dependent hydrolase (beta-lactamase superfamily II)